MLLVARLFALHQLNIKEIIILFEFWWTWSTWILRCILPIDPNKLKPTLSDMNAKDKKGYTPMHVAVERNHVSMKSASHRIHQSVRRWNLSYFFSRTAPRPTSWTSSTWRRFIWLLTWARMKSSRYCLLCLLSHLFYLWLRPYWTPTEWTSIKQETRGKHHCMLLQPKARLKVLSNWYCLQYQFWASLFNAMFRWQLQRGADMSKPCYLGYYPIHTAARNGSAGVMEALLSKGKIFTLFFVKSL